MNKSIALLIFLINLTGLQAIDSPPPLYGFGLDKTQTQQIFKNFLWSLEEAANTGSASSGGKPFGISQADVDKLFSIFQWSLYYSYFGNNLPTSNYTFKITRDEAEPEKEESKEDSKEDDDNGGSSGGSSDENELKVCGEEAFKQMNDYRDSLGIAKEKWNEKVYTMCLDHTKYMVDKGEISHDKFSERINEAGFGMANENVAMFGGSETSEKDAGKKFFDMWKNSSGHDKNMKAEGMNEGAVSCYKKGNSYYATMINVKV